MTRLALIAAAACAALSLGACASEKPPLDTGERIAARGSQISEYGDAWTNGQARVDQGQEMVRSNAHDMERARDAMAEAQETMRKVEADKAEGERMIAEGRDAMQRAEANYAAVRAGPAATPAETRR